MINSFFRQRSRLNNHNSSQATKKQKLSLDPFVNLHTDIHDFIAHQFNGKDLLNLCEVSKNWNEIFKNRATLKTCIRIELSTMTQLVKKTEFSRLMSRSEREYRTIEAVIDAGTKHETFELLKKFAPKIESLGMKHVHDSRNVVVEPASLPNLKHLRLGAMSYDIRRFISSDILTTLQSLSLSADFDCCVGFLHEFLCEMRQLKTLCLENKSSIELFDVLSDENDPFFSSANRFQLESFALGPVVTSMNFENKGMFVDGMTNFLRSQAATLTTVIILVIPDPMILNIIFNELPVVEHIAVCPMSCYTRYRMEQLSVQPNSRIKVAKIVETFPPEHLVAFLTSLPELKKLQMMTLTYEILEIAALNLLKLETIKCNALQANCSARYEELKRNNPNANCNIQLKFQDQA